MWCYSCALFFSLKPWQASLFVCMQGLCLNCCLVSLLFMLAGEVIFCFLFFSFSKDVVIFLLPLPLTARNLLVLTGIRGGSEIKNLASENNMGSHWVWEEKWCQGAAKCRCCPRTWAGCGAQPALLPALSPSKERIAALPWVARCTRHLITGTAPVLNTAALI